MALRHLRSLKKRKHLDAVCKRSGRPNSESYVGMHLLKARKPRMRCVTRGYISR